MDVSVVDMSCSWRIPDPKDYVVQVGGDQKFAKKLKLPLTSLKYVRDCLTKRQPIKLRLVESSIVGIAALDDSTDDRMTKSVYTMPLSGADADRTLGIPTRSLPCYWSSDITKPLDFSISAIDGVTTESILDTGKFSSSNVSLWVHVELYYGGRVATSLHDNVRTSELPFGDARLQKMEDRAFIFPIQVCKIPREAKLCFTLYAREKISSYLYRPTEVVEPLAWVNVNLFDYRGCMLTGTHRLHLWPGAKANPHTSVTPNFDPKSPSIVVNIFGAPDETPIMFHHETTLAFRRKEVLPDIKRRPNAKEISHLIELVKRDSLRLPSPEERKFIWKFRYFIQQHLDAPSSRSPTSDALKDVHIEGALSKVLQCVDWGDPLQVSEVHQFIDECPTIKPVSAMELLDVQFPDKCVREYAVSCFRSLSDQDLVEFLPQLVQVIKCEPYHFSPLVGFLVPRALRKLLVGHSLFWHLKADLHMDGISVRFKLLIETLFMHEDLRHRIEHELMAVQVFTDIANAMKGESELASIEGLDDHERLRMYLSQAMEDGRFPPSFMIPTNPSFVATSVDYSACKVKSSNTRPLYLTLKNDDGDPVKFFFKTGDDVRTDHLALQMIRIMDKLWQAEAAKGRDDGIDLNLCMQPYTVVSTADQVGIIECVTGATTQADIVLNQGGAFYSLYTNHGRSTLANWLKKKNPGERSFRKAQENFVKSLAGYSVATYILGIGDRHNDNIMVSEAGNIFHIDFGYFLGERTKLIGAIDRETAPFVLTEDYIEVMGGDKSEMFGKYVDTCLAAYSIIRKHSNMLITLFIMMLSSGMPQLQKFEDLNYVREALKPELSEGEAEEHFMNLIRQSRAAIRTTFNHTLHMVKKGFPSIW